MMKNYYYASISTRKNNNNKESFYSGDYAASNMEEVEKYLLNKYKNGFFYIYEYSQNSNTPTDYREIKFENNIIVETDY